MYCHTGALTMEDVTDVIDATTVVRQPTPPSSVARHGAEEAARLSGTRIVDLTDLPALHAVEALFDSIWHPEPGNRPITVEVMRALVKAGSYVTGAFLGEEMVGACVGFFAAPAGTALHSHIAGVAPAVQRRNVGRALKLHQRAWAMERGLSRITWTYDPLVARNAWFNIVRLGATPVEYLPDFYGVMQDTINASDQTDRLFVAWSLGSDAVVEACAGRTVPVDLDGLQSGGAVPVLSRGAGGGPVIRSDVSGSPWLVAVPPDVETMRRQDPGLAREWRQAVRAVLGGALDAGGQVRGFTRDGWYVVEECAGPAGAPEVGRTAR